MEFHNTKTCSKCNKTKPLTEFGIRKDSKCGYKSHCKECIKKHGKKQTLEYARNYRKNNIEHIKNYKQNYHDLNFEKLKVQRKEYYEKNKLL